MAVTSLKTRVFLLVAGILALVALFVMLVTQRTVVDTVYRLEERGGANVLRLVALDIEARYRQLLREKIGTVRSYREQLEGTGATVEATLAAFAGLAAEGRIDEAQAQQAALAWLRELPARNGLQVMVYDASLRVIAHPDPDLHGASLAGLRDIKGRDLARDALRAPGGSLFGVYRWPAADETRFGHFRLFAPWNWVVATGAGADAVERAVAEKRAGIVAAVDDTLSRLTLAREGFVFVFDGSGEVIVPPASHAAALLQARDADGGDAFLERLRAIARDPQPARSSFAPADDPDAVWELGATWVKPLDWYVAAAVPRRDLMEPASRLLRTQGAIFLGMLALALLLAWLFASRLIRPLNLLTAYARDLPQRDLTEPHPVPAAVAALPERHRDEVGRLATTILFMEERLHANVLRLMSETSARERIESELSIARDIQLGLLPVRLRADVLTQVDLCAHMTAAKEVGGDLYDYFMLADGRLCFVIGDVSGKGVPAALFMAITRTVVRSAAAEIDSPGRLMENINDRLAEQNPNLMFVTLFVGMLDLATGELRYANAGHPPPWLVADGKVTLLTGRSGPACGVAEGMPYVDFTGHLAPGTVLVGYTDGVTEANDHGGRFYGEDRAVALLEALPAGTGSDAAATALLEDIADFAAGAEQADDITLILVRRRHPNEEAS